MPPQQTQNGTLHDEGLDTHHKGPITMREEVYYDGYFYDVTEFMGRHPGGQIIKFYTEDGEDATIPIQQFHNRSMPRILAIMKSLKRRKAELTPSPPTVKEKDRLEGLTEDFQKLYRELKEEGMFEPSVPHTIYRFTELAIFALLGYFLVVQDHVLPHCLGILSLSMFAGRCGWYMHEGGHHSLTGNPAMDRFLQSFLMGFPTGMSGRWWSSQHNRHHAMPQRLAHDVDLDTLPLIAFNKKVVKEPSEDGTGFFVHHQSKLFILIDCLLVGLFWKFYLHPRYVFKKRAWADLFFMACHYYVVAQFSLATYLVTMWFTAVYIFLNFALSHTHLPVTSEPKHWVEYSLLHTADIHGRTGVTDRMVDWWMCYLNYQIEHHLFPTMPQFRHRQVQPRVKALATKHGIPHISIPYWEAVEATLGNLAKVSEELDAEASMGKGKID